MTTDTTIRALHTAYCGHSQRVVPFHWHTEYVWRELLASLDGYDVTPERAVFLVAMRLKKLERGFPPYSAKWMFRKFTDTEWFCEQLTEALRDIAIEQKRKAQAPDPNTVKMANWTGKPPPEKPVDGKSCKEILESKAFQDFVKLKERL